MTAPAPEAIEAAEAAVRKYYSAGGWVRTADVAKFAVAAAYPLIESQAKAEALREAAAILDQLDRARFGGPESGSYADIQAVACGGTIDWLRARADREEFLAKAMADPEGRRLADAALALANTDIDHWPKGTDE